MRAALFFLLELTGAKKLLSVKISTPTEVVWEGSARSISGENVAGPFDILPDHAGFVTMIKNKIITVKCADRDRQYSFTRALMHVKSNKVRIFGDV